MFWDLVGPDLIGIFKELLQEVMMGKDFNMGMAVLLYKKEKRKCLHNWRPITL